MKFASSVLLALLNYSSSIRLASAQLPSYQSGPSVANTYAGGLVYDQVTNAYYAAGATYVVEDTFQGDVSTCFLALFTNTLVPIDEDVFASQNVPVACSALALDVTNAGSSVVLAGSSEAGGYFPPEGGAAAGVAAHGFLVSLQDATTAQGNLNLGAVMGGATIAESAVNYPVAVAASGDSIYVVSMTSSDTSLTREAQDAGEMPNLTSGGIRKYGSAYAMTIQRYTSSTGTYNLQWSREYATTDGDAPVIVSGLLVHSSSLYVVGSTRGSGDAFGGEGNGTEDGFITKLDIETGDLDVSSLPNGIPRIGKPGTNDILSGICEDPNDPRVFYVVGAAINAEGYTHPEVSRISASTLTPEWTQALSVEGTDALAYALSCQVFGDAIYVAGQTRNGSKLRDAPYAYGGDDVFVAQLEPLSGTVTWVQQVGSAGKDELSQGNGLSVDSSGNAVLYGHTSGAVFRERADGGDSHTDVFAVTFAKQDGSHTMPLDTAMFVDVTDDADAPAETVQEIDFDECYAALDRNDVNRDQGISSAEFLAFAKDFTARDACLGDVDELPFELLVVHNQLNCECAQRGGDADCCLIDTPTFPITGVLPGDPVIIEEQQFLRQVCLRTDQAVLSFCGPPEATTPTDPAPEPTAPAPTEPAPVAAPVVEPTEPAPTEPAPTEPAPAAPEPTEPAPTEPEPTPSAPAPAPTQPSPSNTNPSQEGPNRTLITILASVGGFLLLCGCCVICVRAQKRAEDRAAQRKMVSIFKYLHAFDVDDIDIRRSPAGGYHGTYLNELAQGENPMPEDEESANGRPNMSHSSVADDYTFMSSRKLKSDDDDDSQTDLSSHL